MKNIPRWVDRGRIIYKTVGYDKSGSIYIRKGVNDISLGDALYAKVLIPIDETHCVEGLATYASYDDGPDILVNIDDVNHLYENMIVNATNNKEFMSYICDDSNESLVYVVDDLEETLSRMPRFGKR